MPRHLLDGPGKVVFNVTTMEGKAMNQKYKAVIFDLDGTLLDTLEDLTDSCNQALTGLGYPAHTIAEVRQFVGNGLGVMIEKALPGGRGNPDYDKALDRMREIYSANYQNKTKAYDGVLDLIERLKERGVKMAIVSNKPDAQVKELAALYFKSIPQEAAIGENEAAGVRRKPYPDSVYTALKALGANKEDAVYIGDSDVDMATARNSGLPCISVSWGFKTREFLQEKGASPIVDRPDEVLGLAGF